MMHFQWRGLLFMAATTACVAQDKPIVGAIRWDAWTGGPVTEQVERTLGPKKYQDRLPWFAQVVDDATARIDGSPQAVMDREIELAEGAGLDYWAFLLYPRDSPMSTAIRQYLESPKRKLIHFCTILHNTLNVTEDQWPAERDRAIGFLRESGYRTVLTHRPLVYAFAGNAFPFARFREFLTAARKQGVNPYCVYMGWNPSRDYEAVKSQGFDAVSAYAMGGEQATFSGLVESVRDRCWRNAATAGVPYVPLVTTGWDKRPRKEHPVSWERSQDYHRQAVFPARATPAEIAAHLQEAMEFVSGHPQICPARAVIVYAWNEYDEGGWLAPTRGSDGKPDTSRLDAIRQILRSPENGDYTPANDGLRAPPDQRRRTQENATEQEATRQRQPLE